MDYKTFNDFIKKKELLAKQSGKVTKVFAGYYYYYHNDTLYQISKEKFSHGEEWVWCKDGGKPDDIFSTMRDAQAALFDYLKV